MHESFISTVNSGVGLPSAWDIGIGQTAVTIFLAIYLHQIKPLVIHPLVDVEINIENPKPLILRGVLDRRLA